MAKNSKLRKPFTEVLKYKNQCKKSFCKSKGKCYRRDLKFFEPENGLPTKDCQTKENKSSNKVKPMAFSKFRICGT